MASMIFTYFLASILGILPVSLWLIFFLWQDIRKPEPIRWLIILFLVGMAITPLVWLIENEYLNLLGVKDVNNLNFFLICIVYGGVALIEELTKFFSARLVLKDNRYFDEAIDAMIYLIVLALGFGTVENILVASQEISTVPLLRNTLDILGLRFIGANLLHALCSGLIGYGWALSLLKKNKKFLIWALFSAILLHWFFNVAIIGFGRDMVYFITLVLFLVAIFLLWAFDYLKKIRQPINI